MVLVSLQQWLRLVMTRAARYRMIKMVTRDRVHSVRIKGRNIRVERIVHNRWVAVIMGMVSRIVSKHHDLPSTVMISAEVMQHLKVSVVTATA